MIIRYPQQPYTTSCVWVRDVLPGPMFFYGGRYRAPYILHHQGSDQKKRVEYEAVSMASSSRTQVIALYRMLIKESKKFPSYNFRYSLYKDYVCCQNVKLVSYSCLLTFLPLTSRKVTKAMCNTQFVKGLS